MTTAMRPDAKLRRSNLQVTIVRPVIAYLAALAVGTALLTLVITVFEALSGWPTMVVSDVPMLAAFMVMGMAATTPLPMVAFAWAAHSARAPRPWTDAAFGAVLGVGALMGLRLIAEGAVLISEDAWILPTFALAGAAAGLVYGMMVGRPRA